MPEPPQLAPPDVEEQRLYSELLPNGRDPHPISKGEPEFGSSFGSHHDPKFMAIGEGRNVGQPVNRELRFSAHLYTTTDRHSVPITAAATPICLSISRSILLLGPSHGL
ncbi:hypothetical protein CHARACLAT_025059 [Characodon lateralis]|uniref:Uncharacterized protein n=1 Tax=Characodon lateralis TaxID=208331 RepID=A0ABU7ENC7_9TELE|nr:hypothetical protein [Characodon lateralis]